MSDQELRALCAAYTANGNRVIKYKTGYRSLTPTQRRELNRLDPQPTAFGAYNKTNPHTHRRWSYHENK